MRFAVEIEGRPPHAWLVDTKAGPRPLTDTPKLFDTAEDALAWAKDRLAQLVKATPEYVTIGGLLRFVFGVRVGVARAVRRGVGVEGTLLRVMWGLAAGPDGPRWVMFENGAGANRRLHADPANRRIRATKKAE